MNLIYVRRFVTSPTTSLHSPDLACLEPPYVHRLGHVTDELRFPKLVGGVTPPTNLRGTGGFGNWCPSFLFSRPFPFSLSPSNPFLAATIHAASPLPPPLCGMLPMSLHCHRHYAGHRTARLRRLMRPPSLPHRHQ
jgi:hypothetical protein